MILSNRSTMDFPSVHSNSSSRLVVRKMLSVILEHNISKQEITAETGISLSTMRRILLDSDVELSYYRLRKLLYFYCWVITHRKAE